MSSLYIYFSDFHSADIARINGGSDWLRRFLAHHDNDQKLALAMLWETCEWRKSFGVHGTYSPMHHLIINSL